MKDLTHEERRVTRRKNNDYSGRVRRLDYFRELARTDYQIGDLAIPANGNCFASGKRIMTNGLN